MGDLANGRFGAVFGGLDIGGVWAVFLGAHFCGTCPKGDLAGGGLGRFGLETLNKKISFCGDFG
ncbi:hypothetical protein, partial [Helicobacter bizzozeronii]|uniref:hypothetical protein n=1 Tax=Helicobacter bizzozeronii TaxID=56877 RepID=UPI002552E9CF